MNRKKSNDYTLPVTLVILSLLGTLGSQTPNAYTPHSPYQLRDDSREPVLQDDGLSTDGLTTVTISNSIPNPLVFKIQQNKDKEEVTIEPCKNCKIYKTSTEIPTDICNMGTAKTIAVNPGKNNVYWYFQNAQINDTNATWNLLPGHKYSTCLVMDLSKGRSNWDSK